MSPYLASASTSANVMLASQQIFVVRFLLSLVIFHGSCRLCNTSYVTVITFRRSAPVTVT